MRKKVALGMVFILTFSVLQGQNRISGSVLNAESNLLIEYVNIGIVGRNIGTVSDKNGQFNLLVESQYLNDSLLFSCIGYESFSVKISDITENAIIRLKEKSFLLNEVVVKPSKFKEKRLGINTKSGFMSTGFQDNNLGYECGLLMKNKKRAVIKSVNVNISSCTYDTLFYRLNIYEVKENDSFKNILTEPIYVTASKEDVLNGSLQIDLTEQNIVVNGNFLVTLEHVRDLGRGGLWFPASLKQKTYYRKTSQGKWETGPIGISLSVIANVEQ
ncbi:MAG: carboxypeptidase-like regulatory domain-containing protein [Bacteroidales bacterium]|nr:carboxypeptidase-like regulatory domain-containing protein [Bacteroidales bacterium]